MGKPKQKRKVAIGWAQEKNRSIGIYANRGLAGVFSEFGRLSKGQNCWVLFVDARYDFQEVLEYIQNYG